MGDLTIQGKCTRTAKSAAPRSSSLYFLLPVICGVKQLDKVGSKFLTKPPLSHYSPKFANKAWADNDGYTSYFSCSYRGEVRKSPKGWKQWGRKRGLYSWSVEKSLDQNLETSARPIYEKIISYNELTENERIIWSQFMLSQLCRTPTYMKYENEAKKNFWNN